MLSLDQLTDIIASGERLDVAFKQAPIVALVEHILAAKKSPPAPLSKGGSKTDIPALDEIDHLVYALYGLTDEEIVVVEGKK